MKLFAKVAHFLKEVSQVVGRSFATVSTVILSAYVAEIPAANASHVVASFDESYHVATVRTLLPSVFSRDFSEFRVVSGA